MSKLTSFSNKDKIKIYNVGITSNCFFVHFTLDPTAGRFSDLAGRAWLKHPELISSIKSDIVLSPVLSDFNKKEKILETKDKILMIESLEDNEEFFWSKIEENVKINYFY